jgi:hypothetical protein
MPRTGTRHSCPRTALQSCSAHVRSNTHDRRLTSGAFAIDVVVLNGVFPSTLTAKSCGDFLLLLGVDEAKQWKSSSRADNLLETSSVQFC